IRYWTKQGDLLRLRLRWDQIQSNALQALVLEMEHLGSLIGKVNNTTRNDRSPVVDSDVDHSSIVQIRYPYPASQRQSRVRRCQSVHIVGFAAGGRAAFKVLSVPRGGSDLVGMMSGIFGLDC